MSLQVNSPVAVVFISDPYTKQLTPLSLKWQSRDYQIIKLGLHHHYRQGKTLFHVFSVAAATTFFRLVLDTDTLIWQLTEVSNGHEF